MLCTSMSWTVTSSPTLTYGPPVLRAPRLGAPKLPLDVHLMVSNPDALLDAFLDAGAAWISVHQEVANHLDRTLAHIRAGGAKAGVVLNPATPVETLEDILPSVDFVLLMSVNPGFGGQPFLSIRTRQGTTIAYQVGRTRGLSRTSRSRWTEASDVRPSAPPQLPAYKSASLVPPSSAPPIPSAEIGHLASPCRAGCRLNRACLLVFPKGSQMTCRFPAFRRSLAPSPARSFSEALRLVVHSCRHLASRPLVAMLWP